MKLTTQRKLGFIFMMISAVMWLVQMFFTPTFIHLVSPVISIVCWVVGYCVLGLIGIFMHSEANRKLGEQRFW